LPRALDALQQQFDLVFERGDLLLLLFNSLSELRDNRLMLNSFPRRVLRRVGEQLLEPFVFFSQVRCVHGNTYARIVFWVSE
jgi:hypothetical protein